MLSSLKDKGKKMRYDVRDEDLTVPVVEERFYYAQQRGDPCSQCGIGEMYSMIQFDTYAEGFCEACYMQYEMFMHGPEW